MILVVVHKKFVVIQITFLKNKYLSIIGYNDIELKSIPEESILGLGCGAPLNFADLKRGEILVDLGSGAGIDAFLASKLVR